MVALVKSDIPDSINTVEALLVWGTSLMAYLHPELTVVEAIGSAEKAVAAAPWKIDAASPSVWRHISRSSIALSADWQKGGKLWNFTVPLSGSTIPVEFKS